MWFDFAYQPGDEEAVRSWGLPKWSNCRGDGGDGGGEGDEENSY
ncbi:hypothetical protein NIES4103_64040 [Nostoc sp. NIES-4103]|nr:hypothetical protein NIES4103_64040 [Nostoc sp. NIES-4103]